MPRLLHITATSVPLATACCLPCAIARGGGDYGLDLSYAFYLLIRKPDAEEKKSKREREQ